MLRANRHEAKTNLSALAAKAEAGETDAPNLLPTSGPRALVLGADISGRRCVMGMAAGRLRRLREVTGAVAPSRASADASKATIVSGS
jgi:hypothetical protein